MDDMRQVREAGMMKKKLIVTVSINEEDYIDLECLVNGIESGYIIKTEKEE